MEITNNIGAPSVASKDSSSSLQGKDISSEGFLKLLMAQLKMQNPTNPYDSSTMMQQISQLTSLSSAKELQKTVKDLQGTFATTQAIASAQLVGKQVQVMSDQSKLSQPQGLQGSAIVPPGIDKISINIRDNNDKLVKTIPLDSFSNGVVDFNWDGVDSENKIQADGYYKISASSVVNGEEIEIPTAATFNVDSVAYDRSSSNVILNLDGLGGVSMQDIIKIL